MQHISRIAPNFTAIINLQARIHRDICSAFILARLPQDREVLLTEGAVVLEGLGDLAFGQVAEVADDGRLGELQVVLGLDEPKTEIRILSGAARK